MIGGLHEMGALSRWEYKTGSRKGGRQGSEKRESN